MDNDDLYPRIQKIVNETQFTTANHQKSVILLKRIYNEVDTEEFFKAFQIYLQILLSTSHKPTNPYLTKSIKFFVEFCLSVASSKTHEESFEESEFLLKIFDFLLDTSFNIIESVRYNSCFIMNSLLEKLLQVALSDDLCKKIETTMLERIRDDKYFVRIGAANVMKHFQNPFDPNDVIIATYKQRISNDHNPSVRKCCITNIAPRRDVAPILILKTRDVDVNVRLAAFKKALDYPKHFKIIEKQTIIENGFADDSVIIKNYVERTLLVKWLDYYDNDYLLLIKSLQLISSPEYLKNSTYVINITLKSLFKLKVCNDLVEVLEFDSDKIIEKLFNWERLIFWSSLIDFLQANSATNSLDLIVPDAVKLCDKIQLYIQEHASLKKEDDDSEFNAVLIELFKIVNYCDLSDVYTRGVLKELIFKTIKSYYLPEEIIRSMIECLEKCFNNINETSFFISELISSILYKNNMENSSEDIQKEISEKKSSLLQLNEQLTEKLNEKQFDQAREIQTSITETSKSIEILQATLTNKEQEVEVLDVTKVDIQDLKKALNILVVHLQSPNVKIYSPTFATLKSEIINQLLTHRNTDILVLTMKCYGLLSILSKEVAEESILILGVPIISYNNESDVHIELMKVSIYGVVDSLLAHGTELIASPYARDLTDSFNEEDLSVFMGGISLTQLIQKLVYLMDHEYTEISKVAIHSLCLLVANKVVCSSSLLTRLILKWLNPAEDEDDNYQFGRQMLGNVLEDLPLLYENSVHIQNAFIPILRTIINAPSTSPLADINLENATKFLLNLAISFKNGPLVHINFAYQLLQEINEVVNDSHQNKIYSRILLMLDLNAISNSAIAELLSLCQLLTDQQDNKDVDRNLMKFIRSLQFRRVSEENSNTLSV